MTRIRRQTVEEWFLSLQLRSLARRHFWNPVHLEADVSRVSAAWRAADDRPPYTAILIKAAGLLARRHPVANRAVFQTVFGTRVVEFDGCHVTLPHLIHEGGRAYLIASTVRDADTKSVAAIRDEVRAFGQRPLSSTFISKHFARPREPFWLRTWLRLVHFAAFNLPSAYVKQGGGGIGVSSLLNLADGRFAAWPPAFGPTAFTLCSASVTGDATGDRMRLVVAWDHHAGFGHEAVEAMRSLTRILAAETDEDAAALGP